MSWLQNMNTVLKYPGGFLRLHGRSNSDYFIDGKFPGNKSSDCKPGEKLKNGIKRYYDKKLFKDRLAKSF